MEMKDMPIYEYICTGCNAELEINQKITDEPLSVCPKCSGELKKLISKSSFQLKGSGWYVSDYARKNKSGSAEASCSESKTKPECAGCPNSSS